VRRQSSDFEINRPKKWKFLQLMHFFRRWILSQENAARGNQISTDSNLHVFQRPILNFAPRGKLWTQGRSCPPGVNLVPWRWSYPLGVKFSAHPSILLNCSVFTPVGEWRGAFPLGDKLWGPSPS
jgi:hypothetical protein